MRERSLLFDSPNCCATVLVTNIEQPVCHPFGWLGTLHPIVRRIMSRHPHVHIILESPFSIKKQHWPIPKESFWIPGEIILESFWSTAMRTNPK